MFTVCGLHTGLPVCWILKPLVVYLRSYDHLSNFHLCSHNFWDIFRFGLQLVLGVPYNILKFEVDGTNTLGDMAIQNLGPPLDRRTETLKTLPSHHTSCVRGNQGFNTHIWNLLSCAKLFLPRGGDAWGDDHHCPSIWDWVMWSDFAQWTLPPFGSGDDPRPEPWYF